MGSATVASWIAHGVFFVLLLRAWIELSPRTAVIFALLWCAGYFGLPYILYGELYFLPYVAVLDIVLVLLLARQTAGDLKIH